MWLLDDAPSYYGYVYAPCFCLTLDFFINGAVLENGYYTFISPGLATGYALLNYFAATPDLASRFPIDVYDVILLITL